MLARLKWLGYSRESWCEMSKRGFNNYQSGFSKHPTGCFGFKQHLESDNLRFLVYAAMHGNRAVRRTALQKLHCLPGHNLKGLNIRKCRPSDLLKEDHASHVDIEVTAMRGEREAE